MDGRVMRCRICGRLYQFAAFMVGDQTVCHGCRAEAEKAVLRPDTPEQVARRRGFYGTRTQPEAGNGR